MHFKNSKEKWKSILDRSLWELEDDEIKSLFAPLLLSYYDFPSPYRVFDIVLSLQQIMSFLGMSWYLCGWHNDISCQTQIWRWKLWHKIILKN